MISTPAMLFLSFTTLGISWKVKGTYMLIQISWLRHQIISRWVRTSFLPFYPAESESSLVFHSGFAESTTLKISSDGINSSAQVLEYYADSDYEDEENESTSSSPVIASFALKNNYINLFRTMPLRPMFRVTLYNQIQRGGRSTSSIPREPIFFLNLPIWHLFNSYATYYAMIYFLYTK